MSYMFYILDCLTFFQVSSALCVFWVSFKVQLSRGLILFKIMYFCQSTPSYLLPFCILSIGTWYLVCCTVSDAKVYLLVKILTARVFCIKVYIFSLLQPVNNLWGHTLASCQCCFLAMFYLLPLAACENPCLLSIMTLLVGGGICILNKLLSSS